MDSFYEEWILLKEAVETANELIVTAEIIHW